MNTKDVLAEMEKVSDERTKKIWASHGATGSFFGVKVEDMKKIQKKVKTNQQTIAMELFDSGIGDAQYLAGLMADGNKMSRKEIQHWVENAKWQMVSEYSVAWVAAENEHAVDIALEWIDSKKERIASTGWNTFGSILRITPDEKIDLKLFKKLIARVEKEIHKAPNRVRYCMNQFLIAAGSFSKALNKDAIEAGKRIGVVMVDMGGTACKVPYAPDYIKKVMDKGYLGKKRKSPKC